MVFHVHDRRQCWDCGGLGIVARSVSLRVTEATLQALGWRFIEPNGRMLCPECRWKRRDRPTVVEPRLPGV
jgi:hypothetical protein